MIKLKTISALEVERDRLREALDRQCDNMAFVLNNVSVPDQWYGKFSSELAQNRSALNPHEGEK